jgi:chromosome condensin MukBEF MukE localization factor
MGNYHPQENINATSFLSVSEAKELFARIDYALKSGVHIQRWQQQEAMFRFLERHFQSMKLYYRDFFGIPLEEAGETVNKYYYVDFLPGSRGNIPVENRHFLANEYVIVGFMLYKIVFIDGYIELDSLPALQRMIRQDYEDIKPGVYWALAKARKVNTTEMDDQKVNDVVEKALREFSKIGWIALEGQNFDILPSFQRLPKIYGDYINHPENWLKD